MSSSPVGAAKSSSQLKVSSTSSTTVNTNPSLPLTASTPNYGGSSASSSGIPLASSAMNSSFGGPSGAPAAGASSSSKAPTVGGGGNRPPKLSPPLGFALSASSTGGGNGSPLISLVTSASNLSSAKAAAKAFLRRRRRLAVAVGFIGTSIVAMCIFLLVASGSLGGSWDAAEQHTTAADQKVGSGSSEADARSGKEDREGAAVLPLPIVVPRDSGLGGDNGDVPDKQKNEEEKLPKRDDKDTEDGSVVIPVSPAIPLGGGDDAPTSPTSLRRMLLAVPRLTSAEAVMFGMATKAVSKHKGVMYSQQQRGGGGGVSGSIGAGGATQRCSYGGGGGPSLTTHHHQQPFLHLDYLVNHLANTNRSIQRVLAQYVDVVGPHVLAATASAATEEAGGIVTAYGAVSCAPFAGLGGVPNITLSPSITAPNTISGRIGSRFLGSLMSSTMRPNRHLPQYLQNKALEELLLQSAGDGMRMAVAGSGTGKVDTGRNGEVNENNKNTNHRSPSSQLAKAVGIASELLFATLRADDYAVGKGRLLLSSNYLDAVSEVVADSSAMKFGRRTAEVAAGNANLPITSASPPQYRFNLSAAAGVVSGGTNVAGTLRWDGFVTVFTQSPYPTANRRLAFVSDIARLMPIVDGLLQKRSSGVAGTPTVPPTGPAMPGEGLMGYKVLNGTNATTASGVNGTAVVGGPLPTLAEITKLFVRYSKIGGIPTTASISGGRNGVIAYYRQMWRLFTATTDGATIPLSSASPQHSLNTPTHCAPMTLVAPTFDGAIVQTIQQRGASATNGGGGGGTSAGGSPGTTTTATPSPTPSLSPHPPPLMVLPTFATSDINLAAAALPFVEQLAENHLRDRVAPIALGGVVVGGGGGGFGGGGIGHQAHNGVRRGDSSSSTASPSIDAFGTAEAVEMIAALRDERRSDTQHHARLLASHHHVDEEGSGGGGFASIATTYARRGMSDAVLRASSATNRGNNKLDGSRSMNHPDLLGSTSGSGVSSGDFAIYEPFMDPRSPTYRRLLCVTYTHGAKIATAYTFHMTTTHLCDKHLIFTDKPVSEEVLQHFVSDGRFHIIAMNTPGGEHYDNMWAKTRLILDRIQFMVRGLEERTAEEGANYPDGYGKRAWRPPGVRMPNQTAVRLRSIGGEEAAAALMGRFSSTKSGSEGGSNSDAVTAPSPAPPASVFRVVPATQCKPADVREWYGGSNTSGMVLCRDEASAIEEDGGGKKSASHLRRHIIRKGLRRSSSFRQHAKYGDPSAALSPLSSPHVYYTEGGLAAQQQAHASLARLASPVYGGHKYMGGPFDHRYVNGMETLIGNTSAATTTTTVFPPPIAMTTQPPNPLVTPDDEAAFADGMAKLLAPYCAGYDHIFFSGDDVAIAVPRLRKYISEAEELHSAIIPSEVVVSTSTAGAVGSSVAPSQHRSSSTFTSYHRNALTPFHIGFSMRFFIAGGGYITNRQAFSTYMSAAFHTCYQDNRTSSEDRFVGMCHYEGGGTIVRHASSFGIGEDTISHYSMMATARLTHKLLYFNVLWPKERKFKPWPRGTAIMSRDLALYHYCKNNCMQRGVANNYWMALPKGAAYGFGHVVGVDGMKKAVVAGVPHSTMGLATPQPSSFVSADQALLDFVQSEVFTVLALAPEPTKPPKAAAPPPPKKPAVASLPPGAKVVVVVPNGAAKTPTQQANTQPRQK